MPALWDASAEPQQFLDFLIHAPVHAVLLHNPGIPVLVPSRDRYAVHKLIVGSRHRVDGVAKADMDRRQASTLLLTMVLLRWERDPTDAWMEAWDRNPSWQESTDTSLKSFDEQSLAQTGTGIARGVTSLGGDPTGHGL